VSSALPAFAPSRITIARLRFGCSCFRCSTSLPDVPGKKFEIPVMFLPGRAQLA
jgi:hypothetical protein